MPAGAQNPMPSESYDFFAPLGEFGQPRRHYHQMRRLHNMIKVGGRAFAIVVIIVVVGGGGGGGGVVVTIFRGRFFPSLLLLLTNQQTAGR